MRTTSSLESLNADLVRKFPNHPHLFKFMDHLKLHEYSKFLDLNSLMNDEASPECKRARDIERDQKIKYFSDQLSEKKIDIQIFLEAMANRNILPKSRNLIFHIAI